MDNIHPLIQIILACIASSGFWNWLSNRKASNTKILKSIECLTDDVKSLRDEVDKDRAITARVRIVRFNDELLNDERHSKESFDQCLSDIDEYERYCVSHPEFKNNKTVMSVRHIKNVYEKCESKHNFL